MKAALYSQKSDLDTFLYLSKFISEMDQRKVEVVLEAGLAKNLQLGKNFSTFSNCSELEQLGIDFFFSFGGDGTILNALTFVQNLNIPVIGINTGRLGFLASFSKDEVFFNIDKILNGEMEISQRSVLEVTIPGSDSAFSMSANPAFPFALNDLCITRKETTSMISIDSWIDEKFLTVFWADGLIISTPTGSTAYNLSCGGPILSPENEQFVITPIAPHNLNVRPIVLPENAIIKLKVESRVPTISVSLDSRLYDWDIQHEITIKKADFSLNLMFPKKINFYDKLRERLNWGKDQRN